MIKVQEQMLYDLNRKSSKGNQLKWNIDSLWIKADYAGYEGLVETIVSKILEKSNLLQHEYVHYETEEIEYKNKIHRGCKSVNFIPDGFQLITIERLYALTTGRSLYQSVFRIDSVSARCQFLVNEIIRCTGLKDFGTYLAKILTIDALFLNEDRHFHNIAVMMDRKGKYHLCPIFDQGAALLSDTTYDYPMNVDSYTLMKSVKSKTFSSDFDEQLDVVEKLYGKTIQFTCTKRQIKEMLNQCTEYSEEERNRVYDILCVQFDKYSYLFKDE